MSTLKRIPNKKRVASRNDFFFLAKQFKSLILQKSNILYIPKSTVSALNVLIDYSSVYDEIYPSQTTIAERIGVCRQTVSQSFSVLTVHKIIEEKKQRGKNETCLYKLSPLLYRYKSHLIDILPALKKCLGLTDLTDPFAAYKSTTLSMNNTEDVNKVTIFQHSAWYQPDEYSDHVPEKTIISQEVSDIFGGEPPSTLLEVSSSSHGLYINPSSAVQHDNARTKDPVLWEMTVKHFTKILNEYENDWITNG
jgi:hypothetical protein